MHDYLIPTIGDVPPIETLIVEEPDAHGPFGAKGLGEHALIPTAPAILNAVHNATGVRLRHVPALPHRVRAALKELGMIETARVKPEKIRCDACPVMCFIAEGKAGACDRYANHAGELVRLDPLTVIERGAPAVAFLDQGENAQDWDGDILQGKRTFVTAVGAGTTYPDYKPAPLSSAKRSMARTW